MLLRWPIANLPAFYIIIAELPLENYKNTTKLFLQNKKTSGKFANTPYYK